MEIFADPQNENTVYVLNAPVMKSIDGGKSFSNIPVPHGDNHHLWINPTDNKNPAKPFKLRLMYEANPMAFLVEQAGGKASTGYETIMDIQPTEIHQRVAVILGSRNEVDMCLSYHGIDYSEEPTID